jgi:DNA-directed RNA polymerase subunit beta'
MTLSQVFIRTPLICKLSAGICQVCYGWNFATGKVVELGESVGILAAQSIGEPGTQLTMRTFHTGGIFSGEARGTILSPFTGKIWYDFKNGGEKIRTKYKERAFLTYENKKVVIYQDNVSKSVMYLPKNSVVLAKPGKTIFNKQIIAELPTENIKRFDKSMNFIGLRGKFSGQVCFENNKNRINKKFRIISANIFTYTSFLTNLLNKYYVKNLNLLLSKEQCVIYRKTTKIIVKPSDINISLKNMLSLSKVKSKKITKRFINIRLIIKNDKIILSNKPSCEKVVSRPNFNLTLGKVLNNDFVFPTVKNFYPSQIIQERKNFVLIRKISSTYSNNSSLLNLSGSSFVLKNAIVAYSTYDKQKADDIVQGLPKVEQLFEARKKTSTSLLDNLHYKLSNSFESFQNKYANKVAVRKSIVIIQNLLLTKIQNIYESQGVNISDKHVEVIIKQMTSKVMVTYAGDSSFMVGDIVDLNLIELINHTLVNKIIYEPVVVGITRLSLSSQSFIAAASFQETTKVLIKSALEGRVDWLYGLKENLVLGNIIPSGTGFTKTC